MGWFIFLGAAVGIREGYHLSFDVLLYFLPQGAKLVLYSISDAVVAAFGAGMAWYGAELALSAWDVKLSPYLYISPFFVLSSKKTIFTTMAVMRSAPRPCSKRYS